jgi:broad specificity phosphatase PhoE
MPLFTFVRHGETEWNAAHIRQGWADSPLTAQGELQTRAIEAQLANVHPDIMFSSDLGRAHHTATIIHDELFPQTTLLHDWRIRERCFGTLEGKPVVPTQTDSLFSDDHATPYGAESVAFMNERLRRFISDCALYEVDHILVIAHSGILNRLGYLFIPGFVRKKWSNTETLTLDIQYDDPALLHKPVTAWRPPVS